MANRGTRGAFQVGKLQLANGVQLLTGAGAPTSGTSGTGVGQAGPGSFYFDVTNKQVWLNANTKASPTWALMAGGAIGQYAEVTKSARTSRPRRFSPRRPTR